LTFAVAVALVLVFGGGYSWYSRKTTYPSFFEARKTQSEWRVFLDFGYAQRWGKKDAEIKETPIR